MIEAARATDGSVLFRAGGKFVGRLSCDVYYRHVCHKRNMEIEEIMLKEFPASDSWVKKCEKYKDVECFGTFKRDKVLPDGDEVQKEPVLLMACKVRGGKGWKGFEIGQIRLWDESTIIQSMRISSYLGDVPVTFSGIYAGGIFFAKSATRKEAACFSRIFCGKFLGEQDKKKKPDDWIWSN